MYHRDRGLVQSLESVRVKERENEKEKERDLIHGCALMKIN